MKILRKMSLIDLNGDTVSHEIHCANCVPIRQADTAMAGGPANRAGAIRSVNSDPFFVQTDPNNSHLIPRSGRDAVEIGTAFAVQ